MKRMLAVLAMLLLFTGCALVEADGTQPVGDTTPTDPASTAPTIYESGSTMETATNGAVRSYAVDEDCRAVAVVGENVVLFYDRVIRCYTGTEMRLVKEYPTAAAEFPDYPDVQITSNAIGFYDEVAHRVVMLDSNLKEIARVSLPDTMEGGFALADTLDTLFYCTEDALRGYNLKNGTSRLIRQQSYDAQLVLQNCFGGKILGCEVYTRDRRYIAYINGQTGELLGSSEQSFGLKTGGESYFLPVADGDDIQYLVGTMGETPRVLRIDREEILHMALDMGGVFTQTPTNSGMRLDYYDLSEGKRKASVTLPRELGTVLHSWAEVQNGCLWLLMGDNAGARALYRWELECSAVHDQTMYVEPWFTAENPDNEGLAQCADEAKALGDRFGMDITLGVVPGDCEVSVVAEHRVDRIRTGLASLETALERYPQTVMDAIHQTGRSGGLEIILVRQIQPDRKTYQYWSEGRICVVLALDEDMTAAVDNGLYHVLDTFLFNNTSGLDQWAELNPKGFRYDMNSQDYLDRQEDSRLSGDKRAFVDSLSMSYPLEDRAAVFAAAMGQGNEAVFTSETMQQKLLNLCKAIRDAFGWKKSQEVYPWEQYLETSIAYKPKK